MSEHEKKIFTFKYSYVERVEDSFEVEAENYEEAEEALYRDAPGDEEIEIESWDWRPSPPEVDPKQISLFAGVNHG
ncbi:MAG: hypothetical protein AB7H97_06355 [Pseudobdellovibrionaceae bacterium]